MAYTAADLQSIQDAILDLSTGKRTVRISFNNREETFARSDLGDLERLRQNIAADVARAKGKKRVGVVRSCKGL